MPPMPPVLGRIEGCIERGAKPQASFQDAGIAWVCYCTRCDYDPTGNVSGVCPECGTPVRSPAGGTVGFAEDVSDHGRGAEGD